MIREAQTIERVPYMVIVGVKEAEEGTVSVRCRDSGNTETMPLESFLDKITSEIRDRVCLCREELLHSPENKISIKG